MIVDPRGDTRPYDDALAAALARRGHEVELVSCRYPHTRLAPPVGVRLAERFYRLADRLPSGPRRYARGLEHPVDLAALLPRLARHRPDVIHVQWLPLHAVDRVFWRGLSRGLGVPVVFTAHDALPNAVSARRERRARRNARAFRHVVTHTAHGAEVLSSRFGVAAERVARIPMGAFTGYRDVEPVAPPVPEDVPVAAFVGLLRPYKGLDLLLAAWPLVREQVPDAVLYVGGRPLGEPAAERLAAMAREPGSGVVAELRYIAEGEFAGALLRAACCVLPYRRIDQSAVLLSTLALGCPVVCTDVGGLREVVEESGAGLVVPPDDPAALAGAIARILGDPALRRQFSEAALDTVARVYDWDVAAERTEAVYRQALGRAR